MAVSARDARLAYGELLRVVALKSESDEDATAFRKSDETLRVYFRQELKSSK